MTWDPASLLAFEEDIAKEFAAGHIRAPIHLAGGNEQALIDIFTGGRLPDRAIRPYDWVLAGWRSHYHCLLKGVPPAELKAAILAGHSVSLCFPEHKVLCSGIVGGIAPIAVGIAWSLKRRADESLVHCFLGDMTFEAGIVAESIKYAGRHGLPVRWYVEDNGKSVCTDTRESWGPVSDLTTVRRYGYTLTRPHAGIGKWVRF